MSAKTVRILAVSTLLMAGGLDVSAQTTAPSETVTVTASRSRAVFHKFASAFVNPTRLTERVARWERRICPVVVGQNPHFTAFITQRVKYIARAAGAPVNTDASCTPNIEIIFTAAPQALMDNVRQHQADYLGYVDSNAQREKLATVTRPIQAWYAIESSDLKGRRRVDSGVRLDTGAAMSGPAGDITSDPNGNVFYQSQGLQGIPAYAVTGDHIDDGLHAGFAHVLIVVDSTKLAGEKIVPLSDYIAMLALTQLSSLDACQQLPSIVNRLAADCDHATDGLTQYDLAYLEGLYRMRVGRKLIFQENDIASSMADRLPHQIMASALK